jgi:nicotinate phosphoribosyltransferase
MSAGIGKRVNFAMKYGMVPIGTFPHEWVMFHSGVFGYKRANYLSLEDWITVYDGALGTALIDTFTTRSFLHTLTMKQAKLLDGFRQDSGDEKEVGDAIIARLQEFGIDPRSKVIVFSNALNFPKYKEVADYFRGRVKVSAGIGTNITCDPGIEGYKAANIVMKLSRCRMSAKDPWEKVIKISDDLGKHMGEELEFNIAAHELHLTDS